jgi:hypothetical protein
MLFSVKLWIRKNMPKITFNCPIHKLQTWYPWKLRIHCKKKKKKTPKFLNFFPYINKTFNVAKAIKKIFPFRRKIVVA